MKIYEYQAKQIFKKYNIKVPAGVPAHNIEEAISAVKSFKSSKVVLKAQVYTGGRGKAGGIKLANSVEESEEKIKELFSMRIKGLPVKRILVEEQLKIKHELYLSFILDRDNVCHTLIFSAAGGIDIEELAVNSPEKIIMKNISVFPGIVPFQLRDVVFTLTGMDKDAVRGIYQTAANLYKLFNETEAMLAEINPLVITEDNQCIACDGKISFDDNALYRQSEIASLRIPEDENHYENEAREKKLSYVKLDGNIGCMVNGAGLAMATMDVIKHFGGEPANFLDIGGGAKSSQVKDALSIITQDKNVKVIFVNIFGGIVRCDQVAEGIIKAKDELKMEQPMVIRLIGTNDERAYKMLNERNITTYAAMSEAADEAVRLADE